MTTTSDKAAIVNELEMGENSLTMTQHPPAYSETTPRPVVPVTRVTLVQVERQPQEEEKHNTCLVIYAWFTAVLCCLVGNIFCGIFALIRAGRKNYKVSLILSHVGIAIGVAVITIIVVTYHNSHHAVVTDAQGHRYTVDLYDI